MRKEKEEEGKSWRIVDIRGKKEKQRNDEEGRKRGNLKRERQTDREGGQKRERAIDSEIE